MMQTTNTFLTAGLGLLAAAAFAPAAALTNGNVAVYRVGDGTAALGGTTAAVFVDEYTPTGTLVQSIALPTAAATGQLALTGLGNANSEGFLSVSADGKYLAVPGYNAATGVASGTVTSITAGAIVGRTIGVITVGTGAVDTSTGITDAGSNSRSAYTDGTNAFYAGGSGGFRGQTNGVNGASTAVSTTVTNNRVVRAFGGQLYGVTGSGTGRVGTIGTGTSNTAGQTFTPLPGITSTTVVSGYGFFLADLSAAVAGLDTLYIAADDAGTGGIQKYSLVGGTWTGNGKIGTGADGYRGLDAVVTAGGVQLYAVRGANQLVGLLDTTGYNVTIGGTPTLIASAGTNTAFRGVAVVPEPAGLVGLAAAGVLLRRRRA